MAEISRELRGEVLERFEEGLKPKEVSEIVDGVSYREVQMLRQVWLIGKKGFDSPAEYQEKKLEERGYGSASEYHAELVRRRGFDSEAEYHMHLDVMKHLEEVPLEKKYGEGMDEKVWTEYKRAWKEGRLSGRARRDRLSAITYGILEKEGEPAPLDDVLELFGADKRLFWNVYRDLYEGNRTAPSRKVPAYIEKCLEDVPEDTRRRLEGAAKGFYRENRDVLARFKPTSAAGVSVYVTAGKEGAGITQSYVGEKLSVSRPTIRKLRDLLKESGRL